MRFENWMALKFILENRKKIVFPFLAIVISIVFIFLSLLTREIINKNVVKDLRNIGKNNILIGGDTIYSKDIFFIDTIPDVEYYFYSDMLKKDNNILYKGYSNSLLKKMNLPALRDNDVILDRAQFPDKIVGETIILKVNYENKEFLIRDFYLEQNPLETMKVGKRVILSENGFKNNISDKNYNRLVISFKKNVDFNRYVNLILNNLNKNRDSKLSILETPEVLKKIESIINILNKVLIISLICSIGITGFFIFNTTASFIIERRNSIGILKAMGLPNKKIIRIFIFQNFYLLLSGFLLGGLFSYIFFNIVELILNIKLFLTSIKTIIFIVSIIILGNILGILPIYKLKKSTIINLLKI